LCAPGFGGGVRPGGRLVPPLIRGGPGEEGEAAAEDDARQRRRFLNQLARIRRLVTEREALGSGGGRRSAAERARRAAELAPIEERLVASPIGLRPCPRPGAAGSDQPSRAPPPHGP